MIQVFLLVKATFSMMEYNFTWYFNHFITLKTLSNSEEVISWKSKGLSAEKLNTPTTTNNSLSQTIKWHDDSKKAV